MLFEGLTKLLGDAFKISAVRAIEKMMVNNPELRAQQVNYPVNGYK